MEILHYRLWLYIILFLENFFNILPLVRPYPEEVLGLNVFELPDFGEFFSGVIPVEIDFPVDIGF